MSEYVFTESEAESHIVIMSKQLTIHTKSASDVEKCLLLKVCRQMQLFGSFPPLDTSSFPPLPDILDCLSNLS